MRAIAVLAAVAVASAAPAYRPSSLFFSEYVEGSWYKKAVEIYNPAHTAVKLDDVVVQWHHNGKITSNNNRAYTLKLTGKKIGGRDTFVICREAPGSRKGNTRYQASKSKCDVMVSYNSAASHAVLHNGDDAVELKVNGNIVDTIGKVGTDPGSCWKDSKGACMTKDKTIRRKSFVGSGTNTFDVNQWTITNRDDTSDLGKHKATVTNTWLPKKPASWFKSKSNWSSKHFPRYGEIVGIPAKSVCKYDGKEKPKDNTSPVQGLNLNIDGELEVYKGDLDIGDFGDQPLHCGVKRWASWTTCTQTCTAYNNKGRQSRSRSLTKPLFGGNVCPHGNERRICNDVCCKGFRRNGMGGCDEINECIDNITPDKCHKDAKCTNTIGSYKCACVDGFHGDGFKCTPNAKATNAWLSSAKASTCDARSCIDQIRTSAAGDDCKAGHSACISRPGAANNKEPWLQIDLGKRMEVDGARIYSRESSTSTLGTFKITVSDDALFYSTARVVYEGAGVRDNGHRNAHKDMFRANFTPTKARYMRVTLTGTPRKLNLNEFMPLAVSQLTFPEVKLSYSEAKLTSALLQSRHNSQCVAAKCIDGGLRDWSGGLCAAGGTMCATKVMNNPWLQVDLKNRYEIEAGVVFNSVHNAEQLGTYRIEVSDDPYFVFKSTCTTSTAPATPGPFVNKCQAGTRGRYVRLVLPGRGRKLNINELQVLVKNQLKLAPWGYNKAKLVDAQLSGTYNDHCTAANCIDTKHSIVQGCKTGSTMCHSGTRTEDDKTNPWLQVDLGARYSVLGTVIFNRLDGWFDRLGKHTIVVSDDPYFYTSQTTCATSTAQATYGPFVDKCHKNIKGRYVRVMLPGKNRILNINEVEVLTQGKALPAVDVGYNVANLLQATMSSTYNNHCVAANCIDNNPGELSTAYCRGAPSTMCHTKQSSNPWIQLDMGDRYWIDAVVIFNRLTGYADRLGYHEVHTSDDPSFSDVMSTKVCFKGKAAASPGPFVEPCKGGNVGRYVRLTLPGNNRILNIMEIQVLSKVADKMYNGYKQNYKSTCHCDPEKHGSVSSSCTQHWRHHHVKIKHVTGHLERFSLHPKYAWKHLPGQQFRCKVIGTDAKKGKFQGKCMCCECDGSTPLSKARAALGEP